MIVRTSRLKAGLLRAAAMSALVVMAGLAVAPISARAQSSSSPYTTGYRWDNLRRIVGIISPDPDGSGPIGFPAVRYTYDVDGNLMKTETGFLAAWQDQTIAPANWANFTIKSAKTVTVDAMGNKTQEQVAGGTGESLALTQTAYDADDRVICRAVRMNLATTATNACVLGTAGTYNNVSYNDRITTTHYDGDGRVDYIKRAVGTGNEQFYARYGYSANGNKTAETDASGNLSNYVYDGFDRLIYLYYPSLTTAAGVSNPADYESYTYDNNNNRKTYRRRNGQSYTYNYDAINQQILKTRSDNANLNVTSSYDLMGHLIQAKFADGSGTLSYSYDALGRALTATDMYGKVLKYQYDAASLRTQLTYPDNQVQQYQYNAGNQLSWTGLPDASVGYTIGYETFDRPATITRPNSANTTIGYDNADRVTSYGHSFANTSPSRSVTWGFSFNPAGEIYNTTTTNTDFDYQDQVSTTDNKTFNGLNQDSAIAALATSCSAAGAGYDCSGNLINDGTRRFTYDIDNHMVGFSSAVTTAIYVYDPVGRLSQTTINSTVTRFVYDGTNLVAETDGSGNIQLRYMHTLGTDQPWVQFTGATVTTSAAKYFHANYQGSIVALANSAGNVADADIFRYGAYGEPQDILKSSSFGGERFRYTGQTVLPEAGVYYYKARTYDPIYGRFLQTDPIGSKDDLDLYAYTADDPVDYDDPSGTELGRIYKNLYCEKNCTIDAEGKRDAERYPAFRAYEQGMVLLGTAPLFEFGSEFAFGGEAGDTAEVAGSARNMATEDSAAENAAAAKKPAGRCCFAAGTLISTDYGLRPIETIKIGDQVLSKDAASGATAFKAVTNLVRRHDRDIWVVTFSQVQPDGSNREERFNSTDDHPWRDQNGAWVNTADLKPGQAIQTAYGRNSTVVSVRDTHRTQPTFNLEVADFHTYFVGEDRVWVHNECGGDGGDGPHEDHHITPKYLGGAKKGPTVRLPKAYHQKITNAFRKLWPYGVGVPTAAALAKIMQEVYKQFPLFPPFEK
jgi:RHS repeat-associated protein